MADGQVQWRDVDGEDVHEAINVGDGPWRILLLS